MVFASLSVHLSGWGLDLRSLAGLPPLPTAPTFLPQEWNLEQVWSPILVGSGRQGLSLCLYSGSRVLDECMYVRGEPEWKCVQGGGHVMGDGGAERGAVGGKACLGWLAHEWILHGSLGGDSQQPGSAVSTPHSTQANPGWSSGASSMSPCRQGTCNGPHRIAAVQAP